MSRLSWWFLKHLTIIILAVSSAGQAAATSPGKTLNIADMTAPPPTLDPYKVYGTQAQSFYRQIFGNLIERDEAGRLIPALAERWQYLGKNIWRLKIRRNVFFQDGRRLSSRDLKFSLERLISPSSVRSRRRDFSFIARVEALNENIVDIHTKGPAPTLPARLAQFSMVLPEERLRRQGEAAFFKDPIGAGPFRLIKLDQEKAIFQRHDRYYRGRPQVEKVVFHFIKDPQRRTKMLYRGKLDLLTNVRPALTREIAAYPHVAIVKKPALQFTYVVFDTLAPGPLRDPRVRRALAHWTDVPSLIRYVAHGNGRAVATFVMPQEFGFNGNLKPYTFDPERAKKLLQEAGYANGFTLPSLASDEVEPLVRAVASQWGRLGVKLNIRVAPRSEAIRLWTRTQDFRTYFFAPTNLLLDASYHLRSKLDPQHPVNRFHNSEATELVRSMDQIGDTAEREQVLKRLQEIVHHEVPAITFYQRINIYAVADRVKGFSGYPDTILRLYKLRLMSDSAIGKNFAEDKSP